MNIQTYRSEPERATRFQGKVDDLELARLMHPDVILLELRAAIVSRLADHVMTRLSPAIDKALIEAATLLEKGQP